MLSKNKKIALGVLIGFIVLAGFFYKARFYHFTSASSQTHGEYKRIVSLLPSITEILYALGVEDRVVGVTRFCKYPPQAQLKQHVGGVLDTNYEIIYNLEPDLILLSTNSDDQKKQLEQMGFKVLEVETRNVQGILNSIEMMGRELGVEEKAAEVTNNIRVIIDDVRAKTEHLEKPRVLVTFLRPMGEGAIRDVYVAGNHSYFSDLIEMAGAVNAYQGSAMITSPVLSSEGILRLDPDVIIEVMNEVQHLNLNPDDVIKDWASLSDLKAYKNKRIYLFYKDYAGIPGPRVANALQDMAHFIHPSSPQK